MTDNLTYLLESTYIGLDCSAPTNDPGADVIYYNNKIGPPNGTFWSVDLNGAEECGNASPRWFVAVDVNTQSGGSPGYFINATNLEVNQPRLLFQSSVSIPPDDSYGRTVAYCNLSQVYVESNVTCSFGIDFGHDCGVIAQRPSQLHHASSNLTTLSFSAVFVKIVSNWVQATGPNNNSHSSSIAEYYLEKETTSSILLHFGEAASLVNVSATHFSQRLGRLLNTYMLGSQTVVWNEAQALAEVNTVGMKRAGRKTTGLITNPYKSYVCSWGWLAVLLLASTTMLIASLLTMWWELQTRIPDIMGYCSSLTRDAPYLNLQGGSTLDGIERARLLKDYRITLGAVDGSDEGVGHIAVVPACEAKRPVKGDLYVWVWSTRRKYQTVQR